MIELQLCGRSPILCDQSNRLKCFGRNTSMHAVPICDRFRLLVTLFFCFVSLSSSSFSFFFLSKFTFCSFISSDALWKLSLKFLTNVGNAHRTYKWATNPISRHINSHHNQNRSINRQWNAPKSHLKYGIRWRCYGACERERESVLVVVVVADIEHENGQHTLKEVHNHMK